MRKEVHRLEVDQRPVEVEADETPTAFWGCVVQRSRFSHGGRTPLAPRRRVASLRSDARRRCCLKPTCPDFPTARLVNERRCSLCPRAASTRSEGRRDLDPVGTRRTRPLAHPCRRVRAHRVRWNRRRGRRKGSHGELRPQVRTSCYGCSSLEDADDLLQEMSWASRLLAEADRTVAELGRRVGYDPVYVVRSFRRVHGTTPLQWRRAGRPQHAPCNTLDFRHLCLI